MTTSQDDTEGQRRDPAPSSPCLRAMGSRMRRAREAAGLTPAQVAARITETTGESVTERTVVRWEGADVDPPCSRIYQFARAVGCDASELMCPPPAGAPR